MTAGPGVDHSTPLPLEAGTTQPRSFGGPAIDTWPSGTTKFPRSSEPSLPPGSGPVNNELALAAIHTIWQNVGVDYARIAALLLLINSELARAARDGRVAQIEAVAQQLHAIADKLRTSAALALAGGVVSGGLQIASAGISMGGGIYGMKLTKTTMPPGQNSTDPKVTPDTTTVAPTPPPPSPPPPTPAQPGSGPTPLPGTSTRGTPDPGSTPPGQPDTPEVQVTTETPEPPPPPSETPDAEAPGGSLRSEGDPETLSVDELPADETTPELDEAGRQGKTTELDHTLSQQMSARSHNVVLFTQGLSMMTGSFGELIKGVLEFEAKRTEADIKEEEADVEKQRAYMENTRAFAESMQKSAHDMLQILQQMQEGLHQTTRSIWSRA